MMALRIQFAIRRLNLKSVVEFSTITKTQRQTPEEPLQFFRTSENDPRNHTEDHLYRYYTFSSEDKRILFSSGGIGKQLLKQMDTFGENCLMIRKPAIEILSYMEQADYSRPVNKYVLYGETGTGKSCTLAHLLHHAYLSNKLIVHIPWVLRWFKFPKEFAASTTRPNCWNLPLDTVAWLLQFKQQNYGLLNNPELKVTKTYEWGPNEQTESGTPIINLIEHGINRVKYASDVMIVLMDEIKKASTAGICHTFVAIDGFNGLFTDYTRIKNDQKKFVPSSQVTLTEALLSITESNWCNGSIVLTVDMFAQHSRRDSIYPRYLLSKEGFEHIDPFIPIQTDVYNDEEFNNTIEYFKNRKWIREISPLAVQELRAICKSSPSAIRRYTNSI